MVICNLSINVKRFFNYSWCGEIMVGLDMLECTENLNLNILI